MPGGRVLWWRMQMDMPYVLVAEDEAIIGYDLCQTVSEAGFEVEGPVADVSGATLLVQQRKPDLAILDINLDDGTAYALAETLIAQDVPVIFHSGQVAGEEIARRFPGSIAIEKPCPPKELIERVQRALAQPIAAA